MNRRATTWIAALAVVYALTGLTGGQAGTDLLRDQPRILMVVTSCDVFEQQRIKTGVWLEEFAVPYRLFEEAGYAVTVASPKGGAVPVDPRSLTPEAAPGNRKQAMKVLGDSIPLHEVNPRLFDAVFFPGGHGTMFDFPENTEVQRIVEYFWRNDRPMALVCHGPAALVGAETAMGEVLVKDLRVAVFTNEEEQQVGLKKAVPFLLQSRLEELGAEVIEGEPFKENVVIDGHLITGQNPASSEKAAREMLKQLK